MVKPAVLSAEWISRVSYTRTLVSTLRVNAIAPTLLIFVAFTSTIILSPGFAVMFGIVVMIFWTKLIITVSDELPQSVLIVHTKE